MIAAGPAAKRPPHIVLADAVDAVVDLPLPEFMMGLSRRIVVVAAFVAAAAAALYGSFGEFANVAARAATTTDLAAFAKGKPPVNPVPETPFKLW